MSDQPQEPTASETSPGALTVAEVDLGTALLLQAATAIEEHVESTALSLIRQALAIRQTPDAQELAHLTGSLLTHCASLAAGVEAIPAELRPVRGAGALRDWAQLQADGPADKPLGPWSYARQLALVARNLLQALDERRAAIVARAPYVGRPHLPPLAPSSR
ncbi:MULTISPECIES: DUF6415 family natural product biosynthesis protein [unclassified Streptomyces]|uniref:DUF6415 family natural product biosynthesis protein n=1 Tax=unclassified Streptomyces TaxID=2593676 RepID=UPI0035D64340